MSTHAERWLRLDALCFDSGLSYGAGLRALRAVATHVQADRDDEPLIYIGMVQRWLLAAEAEEASMRQTSRRKR